MVRSMRKYNKWFMAIGGAILMVAWLIGPSSSKLAEMHRNRAVAKIDGHKVTAGDQIQATKELAALTGIMPALVTNIFGIDNRDTNHWLLLTHEAEAAGLVGHTEDGKEFGDQVAEAVIANELQRNFKLMLEVYQSKNPQQARQELIDRFKTQLPMYYRREGLSEDEGELMLARAAGVLRMINEYRGAARVSDRLAATEARKDKDAAITDYVFVPASLTADKIPDPDEATLKAFYDKYKSVKPGEGEYSIGYFFPPRVKLEWLTLDRKAFEGAVVLDPIEVRKRWSQNRTKFPGEFAAERPNVEKEMIAEAADKAMQDAQLTIHAEVLKASKSLDSEGKYKKLPADWEQRRPKLDAIAQAVQAQAKQSGFNIPVPEVTVKAAQWTTLDELAALPGIGRATVHQGGLSIPFSNVIAWTRELPNVDPEQVLVPIQTGLTLAENPLLDTAGNRYYVTVLGARAESSPDSLDEIRDRVLKDYKTVQAFEALKGKSEELRQLAATSGLDAVADSVEPKPAETPKEPGKEADAKKDEKKDEKKVTVKKMAAINRDQGGGDPNLSDADLRKALLAAAQEIDPHTEWAKADASKAFVVIPSSKHLGVGVFHILANSPLTVEAYREADRSIVAERQKKELKLEDAKSENPFSLASLLKRHIYISNDKTIKTPDDLKKDKGES